MAIEWATGIPEISDVKVRLAEGGHPAAPSEIRKGEKLRYTDGDQSWDYVVTDVSQPDDMGVVTLQVEPVQA